MKKCMVALLVFGVVCLGQGFEGPMLTQVIYQATAYTLPAGVWELEGMFGLPVIGLSWVSVSYGLTESLEVGTGLTADLMGLPNLGAKIALDETDTIALAFLTDIAFSVSDGRLHFGSGVALSSVMESLGVYAGTYMQVLPEFSISPYAAADYDLMSNAKLLAELNFLPFRARLGLLLRALNSLDLRGWASFFPFSLGASLSLRF